MGIIRICQHARAFRQFPVVAPERVALSARESKFSSNSPKRRILFHSSGFAFAAIAVSFISLALCSTAAEAECNLPHQLTNGQVADASQVMENLSALASCQAAQAPAGSINSIQYNTDGSSLGGVGPLSNGQLIIGSTGAAPQAANITAGPGIAITNRSGSITISASGTGGALPTIRGSGMQVSSASSYTVHWPGGSIAGDLAIIFVGSGWHMSAVPTGWTSLNQNIASNWSGSVIAKILTAADISAGSVTFGMTGTFDSVVSIVTFQGTTTGISGITSSQNASGNDLEALGAPSSGAGAMYIYFGSARASGAASVNDGSLLQAQSDGSAGTGALYAATSHPFFGAVNFSYGGSHGDYQAIVAVTGP